jgi:hypothetical protein
MRNLEDFALCLKVQSWQEDCISRDCATALEKQMRDEISNNERRVRFFREFLGVRELPQRRSDSKEERYEVYE